MKFTLERSGANTIKRCTHDSIVVGDQTLRQSALVGADFVIVEWSHPQVESFELTTLHPALEKQPELIVLGTGTTHKFPPARLLGKLATMGIGLEVMTTAAASRTYNVLVHEDRSVVAAMIIEPKP